MTGEATQRHRVVQWLAARSVRQLVLAAGAVVLLVSGLFGGLREAQPDPKAPLKLNEPHVAEPFELTIKGVEWSSDLGESIGPSEVGRYLVVFADIETDQDQSVDAFVAQEALRLQGLQGFAKQQFSQDVVKSEDAEPRVLVTADRVRLSEIGPGLAYEVAYVWEQKTSEPLPRTVDLVVRAHQFRQSSLDDQSNWFDMTDDAVGRFPVTELGAS